MIKTGNFSKILYEEAKYMNWGAFFIDVLQIVGGLIAGLVAGFFLARNYMKKYMKKNPPINEQMIKAMMAGMGRTPSQKQINQMMKTMNKYMD